MGVKSAGSADDFYWADWFPAHAWQDRNL